MTDPFILFWTIVVTASIGWYFFLLFYVGWKARREIRQMTRALEERKTDKEIKS
jgi:hypothetical protein